MLPKYLNECLEKPNFSSQVKEVYPVEETCNFQSYCDLLHQQLTQQGADLFLLSLTRDQPISILVRQEYSFLQQNGSSLVLA